MSGQDKIYEMITDRMLELMEQGTIPWKKTWSTGLPTNFKSKKEYRGINLFFLNAAPYSCNLWGSFKQITEKGGKVNKGEHGYPVVFWKFMRKEKDDGTEFSFPLLRYYTVFNMEQTDLPIPKKEDNQNDPIACCEEVIENYENRPNIIPGQRAYYSPSHDLVVCPNYNTFDKSESYYATLFHEMIHSTGHKSRLNRFDSLESSMFGSQSYSKEELIAEMGSSYLCGHCNILPMTEENSASYLSSWMKVLKEDKKLLIQAAGKAQIACDHILNRKFGVESEE